MDYTGTGNSLNVRHPHSLQLIMDSLRYWVTEMHVDGFRFDLASTLAREFYDVDKLSTFFELVQQDPVISQVKLIAEPWDVGPGGYQVGNFPPQWTEWNGKYRDTVRDFWRGEPATLGEFASRFTGSADLYEHDGRRPVASINFVTAHDGFTLADLVSYNEKHNDANGEDNNDGESHNRSWNCGVEGPTDDPAVLDLRARQQRNFLATLLLSQGVPMILHGDELGRTQQGNNNTYAQDSELSWIHWDRADGPLIEFVAALTAAAAGAPDVPPGPLLRRSPGPPRPRATPFPTSCGSRPTAARWNPRTGTAASAGRSACSSTATASADATSRRPRSSTGTCSSGSTPTTRPSTFTVPAEEYAAAWDILVDTAGTLPTDEPVQRRRHASTSRVDALVVLPRPRPRTRRAGQLGGRLGGGVGRRQSADDRQRRRRRRRRDAPPRSTYRLQISRGFDLHAAAGIVDYLAAARRRLGLPVAAAHRRAGVRTTATTWSTTAGRPGTRRRRGPRRAVGGGPRRRARRPRRHRAEPRGRRIADRQPLVVGRARRTARRRGTPRPSTSTGSSASGRLRIPVLGDEDDPELTVASTGELRYHEHRFPLAPDTAARTRSPPRCTTAQHYELVNWRRADAELNYRRFFAVNSLAAIRVEEPWVFDESHVEIVRWVARRARRRAARRPPGRAARPGRLPRRPAPRTDGTYVLVEKILEGGEQLPTSWRTDGTTGYDALADIDRVLVDPAGRARARRSSTPSCAARPPTGPS